MKLLTESLLSIAKLPCMSLFMSISCGPLDRFLAAACCRDASILNLIS